MPPVVYRTIVDPRSYLRALASVNLLECDDSVSALNDMADRWSSDPPPGLSVADLCSAAWYHRNPFALVQFAKIHPPSVHLLLVVAASQSDNARMFQHAALIRPVILSPNLAPWRHCLLQAAIANDASQGESALALLPHVDPNVAIPKRVSDIEHWLWKPSPRTVLEDFTRPLHHALASFDDQSAQWLWENGADPWQTDAAGHNALQFLEHHIEHHDRPAPWFGRDKARDQWLSDWRGRLRSRMQAQVLDLGTPLLDSDEPPKSRRL